MVPIPASTSHSSPGQVRAAAWYQARYCEGIAASPDTSARGPNPGVVGTSRAAVTLSAAVSPRIPNTQRLCTRFTMSIKLTTNSERESTKRTGAKNHGPFGKKLFCAVTAYGG